jgi:prepilin-type N-terminal cleavage/methylation domain-containing protein
MKKEFLTYNKAFTLVEMLLVIAIVGILAGAVFAMIGNSDDAHIKSALSTAKSIMPYAQECLFDTTDLEQATPGDPICSGSVTDWPEIGTDRCEYAPNPDVDAWRFICPLLNDSSKYIICSVASTTGGAEPGNCVVLP